MVLVGRVQVQGASTIALSGKVAVGSCSLLSVEKKITAKMERRDRPAGHMEQFLHL